MNPIFNFFVLLHRLKKEDNLSCWFLILSLVFHADQIYWLISKIAFVVPIAYRLSSWFPYQEQRYCTFVAKMRQHIDTPFRIHTLSNWREVGLLIQSADQSYLNQ